MADYFGIGVELVSDDEMMESHRMDLEKFVVDLLEDAPGVSHTTTVIKNKSVAGGISAHARKNDVDLLALGTRGRTGLKVLLLGTTAEKVVHAATCSILAVKPEDFSYGHT